MAEIDIKRFNEVMDALEKGEIRVAEKGPDGQWKVNMWIKEVILAGFRLGARTMLEVLDGSDMLGGIEE